VNINHLNPKWLALILILASSSANAVIVYFDDATRGPSDTLEIGSVTISPLLGGGNVGGQVATVAGFGLGLDNGIGSIGEIERQQHFSANQTLPYEPDSDSGPDGVDLAVNGIINSVTILPNFSIIQNGSTLSEQLPLDFYCFPIAEYPFLIPPFSGPVTIDASFITTASTVELQMNGDWGGEYWRFWGTDFRDPTQEQSFQFGFTIQSLDYTPAPEPASLSLLAFGMLAIISKIRVTKVLRCLSNP